MSVPLGDRGPSPAQFIETADKIEDRAMDVCRRWPKAWFFIITNRTLILASEIAEHAQKANSFFPVTTERERAERLIELQKALGATYAFAKKIERAYKKFPICGEKRHRSIYDMDVKSSNILEEFMRLCHEEEEALKGNIHYTRKINIPGR